MNPILFVSLGLYFAGVAGSAILGVKSVLLTEKGRATLKLPLIKRGRKLEQYSMALCAAACLMDTLLLAFARTLVPGFVLVLVVLPGLIWLGGNTLAIYRHNTANGGIPAGTRTDYDRMRAEFLSSTGHPLSTITTDDQYKAALRFHTEKRALDQLARDCGNAQRTLTMTQYEFMQELSDEIARSQSRYPRLMYGQGWYDNVQSQLTRLDALLREARELIDSKSLKYQGALDNLKDAAADLDAIKSSVEGPTSLQDDLPQEAGSAEPSGAATTVDGCDDEWQEASIDFNLADVEYVLDDKITLAGEAVRLLKAEAAGQIKYETPAYTLYAWAGDKRPWSSEQSESWLKQAIAQGRDPDADTKPIDLLAALQGLSYLWEISGRYEEAEVLLREALPLQRNKPGWAGTLALDEGEIYERLGHICAGQKKWTDADVCFLNALHLFSSNPSHGLLGFVRVSETYSKVLSHTGRPFEAERLLKEALALCEKHGFTEPGSLAPLRKTVNALIQHYLEARRYDEAARLVDLVISHDGTRRVAAGNPAMLRAYAQAYRAVGRGKEADDYGLDKRAAELEAEMARIQADPDYQKRLELRHAHRLQRFCKLLRRERLLAGRQVSK